MGCLPSGTKPAHLKDGYRVRARAEGASLPWPFNNARLSQNGRFLANAVAFYLTIERTGGTSATSAPCPMHW
jgi:hypothetical protein